MPAIIKIKRRKEEAIKSMVISRGEPVFSYDTQKIYVGDGERVGGYLMGGFPYYDAFTLLGKNSSFTAKVRCTYGIDTSVSSITVILPESPTIGDRIRFIDVKESFDTNDLYLDGNGNKIEGTVTSSYDISTNGAFELCYGTKPGSPDIISWWIIKSHGVDWIDFTPENNWIIKYTEIDYTALNNYYVLVNTTSGIVNITLPLNPKIGDRVQVVDKEKTFGIHQCNILPSSGDTIRGSISSYILNTNGLIANFIYGISPDDFTLTWLVKTGWNLRSVIDDDAGSGVYDNTWSTNKLIDEFNKKLSRDGSLPMTGDLEMGDGTITHRILSLSDPIDDTDALNLQYFNANIITTHHLLTDLSLHLDDHPQYLFTNGSRQVTGNLLLGDGTTNHYIQNVRNPVNNQDVVTKNYLDLNVVKLAGSTMTGNLLLGDGTTNHYIQNVKDPENNQDAVTLNYVNNYVGMVKFRPADTTTCTLSVSQLKGNVVVSNFSANGPLTVNLPIMDQANVTSFFSVSFLCEASNLFTVQVPANYNLQWLTETDSGGRTAYTNIMGTYWSMTFIQKPGSPDIWMIHDINGYLEHT